MERRFTARGDGLLRLGLAFLLMLATASAAPALPPMPSMPEAPMPEEGAAGVDLPLNVQLADAKGMEVLTSMAHVLEAKLAVEAGLEGSVSLDLEGTTVADAMDAVCEQMGCRWLDLKGSPRVLRVLRRDGLTGETIDVSLRDADLADLFGALARSFGMGLSADLDGAPTVDVELDAVPLADALDEICERAGCRWWLEGDPAHMRVERLPDSTARVPPASKPLQVNLAGAQPEPPREPLAGTGLPVEVSLRAGSGKATGSAVLSWPRPSLRLGLRAAAGEAGGWSWEGTVSRLALPGAPAAVLPILHRCPAAAPSRAESHPFALIELPPGSPAALSSSASSALPWRGAWKGAELEVRAGGQEAKEAAAGPAETAALCGGDLFLRVTFREGRNQLLNSRILRPGGSLLLADHAAVQKLSGEQAVLLLGWEGEGRLLAGILSHGAGGFELKRRALSLGEEWVTPLPAANGGEATLTLSVGRL